MCKGLPMTDHPPLMASGEVIALLGIDRSTLVRRIAAGKIRYVQKLPGLRGGYLFDRAEVERYVAEQEQAKAS
jgi:excisionase family DNA binding protein